MSFFKILTLTMSDVNSDQIQGNDKKQTHRSAKATPAERDRKKIIKNDMLLEM